MSGELITGQNAFFKTLVHIVGTDAEIKPLVVLFKY